MRISMKTALMAAGLAAIIPVATALAAEAGRSTTDQGEVVRPEASGISGRMHHETPTRMGHPDGPIENQLNKGRPGANGR